MVDDLQRHALESPALDVAMRRLPNVARNVPLKFAFEVSAIRARAGRSSGCGYLRSVASRPCSNLRLDSSAAPLIRGPQAREDAAI